MIYTLTFNPSLDYVIGLDKLNPGQINRTTYEYVYPGGKGINVSIVLSALGCANRALGFVAGFTGEELEKRICELDCDAQMIRVEDGMTRINVKIHADEETELNGQGPIITKYAMEKLYQMMEKLVDGDTLVLSGSVPKTVSEKVYEELLERIKGKKIRVVVDAAKDLLLNTLKYNPFLIKPNKEELEQIFEKSFGTTDEIVCAAKELQQKGAQNVLISMGGDGAILLDETGKLYEEKAIKGMVKNSVGAGDAMVAGFLSGYQKNNDFEEALKWGMAAGSATAFHFWLANKEEIEIIFTNYCNEQ